MRKAYSYIRFSSAEQAIGDSLRRQTEGAEQWCTERGITLDETLRDLGVSAYRGANRTEGALRSFLDLVERGEVEEVNRAEFAGGCLVKVMQPWPVRPAWRNTSPRLRLAECCRWAPEAVGG